MIYRTCLAALLALSTSASAQNVNGNDLYSMCQSDTVELRAYCSGYVTGVNEGFHFSTFIVALKSGIEFENAEEANLHVGRILGVCIPPEVTALQLQDIVTAWLRDNPADRHTPARMAAFMALGEAFPCDLSE